MSLSSFPEPALFELYDYFVYHDCVLMHLLPAQPSTIHHLSGLHGALIDMAVTYTIDYAPVSLIYQ